MRNSTKGSTLGERIRAVREERSMTLQEVANRADLTVSNLSQIERGVINPSVPSLQRIARALDTPVYQFFLDNSDDQMIVRRHKRKRYQSIDGAADYELLVPDTRRKMQVSQFTIEPGQVSRLEPFSHPGEECIIILQGCCAVEIAGQLYDLEEGDTIYFDASLPHRILNRGKVTLVGIICDTPPSF